MNIKVKCKNCDWEGQAIVGKEGFPLDKYKCPECGQNIERAREDMIIIVKRPN